MSSELASLQLDSVSPSAETLMRGVNPERDTIFYPFDSDTAPVRLEIDHL